MKTLIFKYSISLVGLIFIVIFSVVVMPPLIQDPDILEALAAGFVNPFASGYSADVIACWFILTIWIIYESKIVKYGWICVLLGLFPGVAVGFAGYLLLRLRLIQDIESS